MSLRNTTRFGSLLMILCLAMAGLVEPAVAAAPSDTSKPKKARVEQAKPAEPAAEKSKSAKAPAPKPVKTKVAPAAKPREVPAATDNVVTEAAPVRRRRPLSEDVDADLVQMPKPDEIIPPNAPLREDEEQAIAKLRQHGFSVRFDPNAEPRTPPPPAANQNRFEQGDREVAKRVNTLAFSAPATANRAPDSARSAPVPAKPNPAPRPIEAEPAAVGPAYERPAPATPAPAAGPAYPPVEDRSISSGGLTAGPVEPNLPPEAARATPATPVWEGPQNPAVSGNYRNASPASPIANVSPAPNDEPVPAAPTVFDKPGQRDSNTGQDALDRGDSGSAVKEYRALAEQGDTAAQTQLAEMYLTGRGVDKDPRQALTWYEQAAQHGNAEAQYSLGNMYFMGEGVPQDDAQAATWYRRAADQGHLAAKQNLDNLYRVRQASPP